MRASTLILAIVCIVAAFAFYALDKGNPMSMLLVLPAVGLISKDAIEQKKGRQRAEQQREEAVGEATQLQMKVDELRKEAGK